MIPESSTDSANGQWVRTALGLWGWVQPGPLGLGFLDQLLFPVVLSILMSDLGLLGDGALVEETVEDAGAESSVPQDLSMDQCQCLAEARSGKLTLVVCGERTIAGDDK